MSSVQQKLVGAPPPQRRNAPRQHVRLAAALGVERRTLEVVLARAQRKLDNLRALPLGELKRLVGPADAERVFYLVQWERIQAHLELYGTLPDEDLGSLLKTLTPIFERHFSQGVRLNDALTRYRSELVSPAPDTCLSLTPPPPSRRFLRWLGF